eukprot:CAMPEP_0113710336 /NCGR_PEP_ID=MMETSP0038_2-20120614/30095_1 /TAXON_ID=2898 /ORGANISM="Cryptomonas paramecium" /LENGTH=139 /DNA_ID=CAMNT_0000636371 /DNA_START=77 /DNA_END=493 /DNA_ORIENTATION=- /assembly_acc=CAM_ASM_000170
MANFTLSQLDVDAFESILRRNRGQLSEFLNNVDQKHFLVRRDGSSKTLSVWSKAPSDVDVTNCVSFSKKDDSRVDPKDVGRFLVYQAGAHPEMEVLSEEATREVLDRIQNAIAAAELARSNSSSSTPAQTPKKQGPEFE